MIISKLLFGHQINESMIPFVYSIDDQIQQVIYDLREIALERLGSDNFAGLQSMFDVCRETTDMMQRIYSEFPQRPK